MKHTVFTALDEHDEEWDHRDAADVYHLDSLPGETEIAFRLRRAFEDHGYLVRDIRYAPTHPVVVFRASQGNAPRISDPRSLFRRVQGLLREAVIPLRRDELTANQTGKRILVAFQWHESPIDYAHGLRQADEDAAALLETVQ
jgi:hypothetical protein